MKKKILGVAIFLVACMSLTGCDRTAPELSGLETTLAIDCGKTLNLEDYLNENLNISDETDNGTVDYKLSDLEHTIECDEKIYNSESGDVDTSISGEYQVRVTVSDLKNNKSTSDFTLIINPLKVESTIEDVVKIDCGTSFNVKDYFNEGITITNQDGTEEYSLSDFDYQINCDESAYYANTGVFDTGKFGDYDISLTLDESTFDVAKIEFTLELNPLVIDKGSYTYHSDIASTGYEFLGFCEYKNTSDEDLQIESIKFQYFDKDDVMIASNDMPEYSLEYVASGASGYAYDTYSSFNSAISSADEIARVETLIKYGKPTGADSTSLEVGDVEITNNYDYNVSHFAGTAVVNNPYDKTVEYFTLLAGLYDADGKLIGVMESMDYNAINANSKSRQTAAWLPDSREIPDQVKSVRASARVTSFE